MNAERERVLVTGSSGLIGSAVVERFSPRYHVIGFDFHGPPHPPPTADLVEVDLRCEQSVRDGLRQVRDRHGDRIASVIHLAAYYDFSGEPSSKYEDITVKGTERLLHGLHDFQVGQLIFSSTMLVHAPGENIDENAPLLPKWDYPNSKVQTEELLTAQHGDIPIVLLRIAGVYDDECHSIPLANQIQRINERRLTSKVYPGDTNRGQAFLHLDDLLDAFERLVDRRAELPSELTLLLGERQTLSYDELQRAFGRLIHGEEWETQQIPKAVAKTGAWLQDNMPFMEDPFIKPFMIDLADDHYSLNIGRARSLLGWEPRHSLRDSLPKMIQALTADPHQWYKENKLKPPPDLADQGA